MTKVTHKTPPPRELPCGCFIDPRGAVVEPCRDIKPTVDEANALIRQAFTQPADNVVRVRSLEKAVRKHLMASKALLSRHKGDLDEARAAYKRGKKADKKRPGWLSQG